MPPCVTHAGVCGMFVLIDPLPIPVAWSRSARALLTRCTNRYWFVDMTSDSCELLCLDLPQAEKVRARVPADDGVRPAADRARALADPTRLRVARALYVGEELCVCDLAWVCSATQNLVSHHVRQLRVAGLATADTGVAVGAMGTDVAIKAADVTLMGEDLPVLPRAGPPAPVQGDHAPEPGALRRHPARARPAVGLRGAGAGRGDPHPRTSRGTGHRQRCPRRTPPVRRSRQLRHDATDAGEGPGTGQIARGTPFPQ